MKKLVISALTCVLLSAAVFAQQQEIPKNLDTPPSPNATAATHPQVDTSLVSDTTQTLVWYINDYNSGQSTTTWAVRIVRSKMEFVQPTPEQLQATELHLKRQKVPVDSVYYVPLVTETVDKKTKKKVPHVQYAVLPGQLKILDFGIAPVQPAKKEADTTAPVPPAAAKPKK